MLTTFDPEGRVELGKADWLLSGRHSRCRYSTPEVLCAVDGTSQVASYVVPVRRGPDVVCLDHGEEQRSEFLRASYRDFVRRIAGSRGSKATKDGGRAEGPTKAKKEGER